MGSKEGSKEHTDAQTSSDLVLNMVVCLANDIG